MPVSLPDSAINHLVSRLYEVLKAAPAALREHELLAMLNQQGFSEFGDQIYRDNHSLYQTHFLLFHCLYKLRDQLREQKSAELEIHCLNIRLHLYSEPDIVTQLLQQQDPLRDYYLDLNNLENTSAEDVEELIYGFWQHFSVNDQRQQALEVLGLSDPVEYTEIKAQYRRLAMEHHPDRGGDGEILQAINAAMRVLQ